MVPQKDTLPAPGPQERLRRGERRSDFGPHMVVGWGLGFWDDQFPSHKLGMRHVPRNVPLP